MHPCVVVSGAFDDLRSRQIRFLHEAARWGELTVLLEADASRSSPADKPAKFPLEERKYFLEALRYVRRVIVVPPGEEAHRLPDLDRLAPQIWAASESHPSRLQEAVCIQRGVDYRIIPNASLDGFPEVPPGDWSVPDTNASTASRAAASVSAAPRKRVLVTGCYDWFHSGHIRFFEEVSGHGELYVVVGHDANIRLLKGEGHPLLPQEERRYLVQAIRYVHQALVSTGHGWMDAEPEIERIRPDIYAVNEDGDRPEKQAFCARHGLEYLVLRRTPAPGLPKRSSTDLRGF
jgi:cytidyltransferase-like protein